jgi:ribonuclease P protein component
LTDHNRFINILFSNKKDRKKDEKNVSTEQKKTKEEPWFPRADEEQRGPAHHQEPQTQRQKKTRCLMDERFTSQEKIRKKKDFLHLYKKGKRYRGKYFTLIYLSNELNFSRVAVVASKKLGNAVQRNRTKRWLRTLFRRNKELLKSPFDMIFIPRKEIHEAKWQNLENEYLAALKCIQPENQI